MSCCCSICKAALCVSPGRSCLHHLYMSGYVMSLSSSGCSRFLEALWSAIIVHFQLSHQLPQILANRAAGIHWSWHFSNDSISWNGLWFHPKQHVLMNTTTLLIFLLPDIDHNISQWSTLAVAEVCFQVPLEPLFCSHHTNIWVSSYRLSIGDRLSQVDVFYLLCGAPSIPNSCLHMRPAITD